MVPQASPFSDFDAESLTADRPYLTTIDDSPFAVMTALRWAKYLSDTFGLVETRTYLDYYERLGWISPSVTYEMARYTHRFADDNRDDSSESGDNIDATSTDPDLDTAIDAHARSLHYIAVLADADINLHLDAMQQLDAHPGLSGNFTLETPTTESSSNSEAGSTVTSTDTPAETEEQMDNDVSENTTEEVDDDCSDSDSQEDEQTESSEGDPSNDETTDSGSDDEGTTKTDES